MSVEKEFSKSLREGNLNAYNNLFKSHYNKLYGYALKLCHNSNLAKDIVQETFIKLWLNKEKINPELSISNYLLKICHNEFLNHLRSKKKEEAFLEQIKIETAFEMFTFSENESSKENDVKKMINKLSPKCKEALVLSKYENKKYTEIAFIMGISVKTVENHISKAYSELRKNLQYLNLFFKLIIFLTYLDLIKFFINS